MPMSDPESTKPSPDAVRSPKEPTAQQPSTMRRTSAAASATQQPRTRTKKTPPPAGLDRASVQTGIRGTETASRPRVVAEAEPSRGRAANTPSSAADSLPRRPRVWPD